VPLVEWLSAVKLDTSLVVERGEALGVSPRADKALNEPFEACLFNLNSSSTSVGKLISSTSLRFELVSHAAKEGLVSDRDVLIRFSFCAFLVSSIDRRPFASSLKNSIVAN
jgi:hypothetical protein